MVGLDEFILVSKARGSSLVATMLLLLNLITAKDDTWFAAEPTPSSRLVSS